MRTSSCGFGLRSLEEVIRISEKREDQSQSLTKLALVLNIVRLIVELLR